MSDKTTAKAAATPQQQPAPRAPRTRSVRPPASQVRLRAEQLPGAAPPPRESEATAPVPSSEITASPAGNPTPANDEADQQTVRYVADRIVGAIATGRYESALAEIEALTLRQRGFLLEDYARRNNSNYFDSKSDQPTQNLWDYVKVIVRSGLTGPGFARVIAVLRNLPSQHIVADLAEGLISKKSDEANVSNKISSIPQESRKITLSLYNAYYGDFGIGSDIYDRALYEHLVAALKEDVSIRRVYALLDHPPTVAEQLYYAVGDAGSNDERTAQSILIGELSKGSDALVTIQTDWKAYVQNQNGWLPTQPKAAGTLEATVNSGSTTDVREILELLLYQQSRLTSLEREAGQTQDADRQAQLGDLASQTSSVVINKIAQILKPGLLASLSASDPTIRLAFVRQARIVRERAQEARQKVREGNRGKEALAENDATITSLRKAIDAPDSEYQAIRALATDRYEEDRFELLRQQDETLADEIYFLAMQKGSGYSAAIVKRVKDIWQNDGALAEFLTGTRTPVISDLTGLPLRPAYNPAVDLRLDEPYLQRFRVSIAGNFDSVARGAARIALELEAEGDAALKAVDELLEPLPLEQRQAIVGEFMRVKVGLTPRNANGVAQDFRLFYLDFNFTPSEVGTRIVQRLSPAATDLRTGGQQASERDRDTERPALRFLGSAASRTFFNGEGNEQAVEAARERFFDFQRLKEQRPEAFRDLLAFYGVRTEAELVSKLTTNFDQQLATREGAREAAAGVIEKFITLVTRSALVVALGPTGLPGLLASLGGFVSGFLVHSGISGGSYDLFSRVNLATLLEEVAATVFEVAKIEDIISQTVKLAAAPRNLLSGGKTNSLDVEAFLAWVARKPTIVNGKEIVEAAPFPLQPSSAASTGIAILSGILKSQGTKLLEKGVGNAVAGVDLPSIHEFIGKYIVANLIVATGKNKLSPSAKVDIETEFLTRLPLNIAAVAVHGPPPGAAFARAVVSELIKILAVTPPDQINPDKIGDALQQQVLWSAVFAVSVGTAQSIVGAARGRQTLEQAEAAPDTTTELLRNQSIIKDGIPTSPFKVAYDKYKADVVSRSQTPLSGLQFLRNRELLDQYYPGQAADHAGLIKAFDNYGIFIDNGTQFDERKPQ